MASSSATFSALSGIPPSARTPSQYAFAAVVDTAPFFASTSAGIVVTAGPAPKTRVWNACPSSSTSTAGRSGWSAAYRNSAGQDGSVSLRAPVDDSAGCAW